MAETELAAPAASTQNDDDYVHIRVPREKVAPRDTGLTETVQHHVSQSAEPQNTAPILRSVPVQLPAPASQQWLGDSSTISYARVSVLQPGGSGYTSGDTVDTEPHLVVLTRHVAGRYHTHLEAFRHALLGDPPARLEPMTVRLQPGARDVRAKPRASPPAQVVWLHDHMANLETVRMAFRNAQAIYGSRAMAIPKGSKWSRTIGPSTTRSNR